MSKALESGKSLAEIVLAKFPENMRDDLRAKFATPEATDALITLGASALAQSDYSRVMDEMREKEAAIVEDYGKLNGWYETHKDRLGKVETLEAEIARLTGAPAPRTPTTTTTTAPAGLTHADLAKAFEENGKQWLQVMAFSDTLGLKHFKDFNEALDSMAIAAHATKHQVSLDDAYKTVYAEKLAAKAKADQDALINKQVEERLAERMKSQGDQPFPLRNQSPSVLDILQTKDDAPANHNLDTAVAEYERLMATR